MLSNYSPAPAPVEKPQDIIPGEVTTDLAPAPTPAPTAETATTEPEPQASEPGDEDGEELPKRVRVESFPEHERKAFKVAKTLGISIEEAIKITKAANPASNPEPQEAVDPFAGIPADVPRDPAEIDAQIKATIGETRKLRAAIKSAAEAFEPTEALEAQLESLFERSERLADARPAIAEAHNKLAAQATEAEQRQIQALQAAYKDDGIDNPESGLRRAMEVVRSRWESLQDERLHDPRFLAKLAEAGEVEMARHPAKYASTASAAAPAPAPQQQTAPKHQPVLPVSGSAATPPPPAPATFDVSKLTRAQLDELLSGDIAMV